ncbi:ABC transporter permease subunit [Pseudonocardia bannensis]|uniref:ABC transporter permease subunit n=2 Tax=Pseudonocardia bannensis TaxID=630973 RepID=A0A848DIW4_9PSEU|nr:ABC transporter permease subunit [Pseudonocardia bannensis]
MVVHERSRPGVGRPSPAWLVVAERELRDLWIGGKGPLLIFAHTLLLSVTAYLAGVNEALNFLEQREAVDLILEVAVAVGSLLVLLSAADAISGERERGTLEAVLLAPAPRCALVLGKAIAALSLWVAAYAVSVPYLWHLGSGVGLFATAAAGGLLVGTLLALFLVGLGLFTSTLARSNRVSLSVSLLLLLVLVAPSRLPAVVQDSWAGQLLSRIDPFTAGLRFLAKVVVEGHRVGQEVGWLVGPLAAAAIALAAALVAGARLTLRPGERA